MKKKSLTIITFVYLVFISCSSNSYTVYSPDKQTEVTVLTNKDTLYLGFASRGVHLLNPSPIVIELDGEMIKWDIRGERNERLSEKIDLLTGEYDSVSEVWTEAVFDMEGKANAGKPLKGQLLIRVYENVMAYRILINNTGKYQVEEKSEWIPVGTEGKYMMPNGEYEPLGPLALSEMEEGKMYFSPVVYSCPDFVLGIHEADLHDYPQLSVGKGIMSSGLLLNPGKIEQTGDLSFPWRVILFGDHLADLHNRKKVYQSLNPPAEGEYGWVKPGISFWDWRVKGATFDRFTYGMDTESLKRFIHYASELGVDYFLLDAEWHVEDKPLEPIATLDIQEIIRYANNKNVGMWLYYDLKYMSVGDNPEMDFEDVAKTFSSWGAKGIKYGFLGSAGVKYDSRGKVKRAKELIETAAKYKLMINFHDDPVPFSGLERTYPNYMNREYCHAQLDRRMAFTPGQFVKMACVNFLAGPMDQTNGMYALDHIKSRLKGPRNDYNSTVASENARFFITHTGHFSVLIDAPEAYMAKPELFDFIKRLPKRWDETLYLEQLFDSHVSVARREGDEWFLGTVFDEKGGNHTLRLDFLEEGQGYEAVIYCDDDDSHYVNNKESYRVETQRVSRSDILSVTVAPGGGYSVIFTKL